MRRVCVLAVLLLAAATRADPLEDVRLRRAVAEQSATLDAYSTFARSWALRLWSPMQADRLLDAARERVEEDTHLGAETARRLADLLRRPFGD